MVVKIIEIVGTFSKFMRLELVMICCDVFQKGISLTGNIVHLWLVAYSDKYTCKEPSDLFILFDDSYIFQQL